MNTKPPVVILGAGLAGLTAATYLRRHHVNVQVYEAGPHVAGLAASSRDVDGYTYDYGAHFITNRLAAAVGVAATCTPMPRYGESVWLRRSVYSYPFGMMRNGRFVSSAVVSKVRGLFRRRRPANASEWFRAAYGTELAERVAMPLTQAWSGAPTDELSVSVGEKFATSLPRTVMLKAAARLTRRTVAVGYSGTVTESPHVWHVYPSGGIGAVCEALANEVSECVKTKSPVEAIRVENERVVGVRVAGQDVPASAVVSTAPVHILSKLTVGTEALRPLAQFRYRPMVFVNLRIDGPSGLPDVVTWVPEKDYPFFRLSDIGLGLPWLVPQGKTIVTADIGCDVGDAVWNASDETLGETCIAALERMVPGIRARYLGCRVMRTPLAYPVYRLDYEETRRRFAEGTGVKGLMSVGRNGEFAHILMEDVYWRTRRTMHEWLMSRERRSSTC